MLIYIEFISRRPGVGLHEFHRVAGHGQSGWAGEYDDDLCVLNVGRSWRIGPELEYMCVWYSARHGLDRIDDWESVFRSGDADHLEEPFRLAARIDRAGCYEPLLEPLAGSKGRYYAEWIDFAPDATRHDVSHYYGQRRAAHPDSSSTCSATASASSPRSRGRSPCGGCPRGRPLRRSAVSSTTATPPCTSWRRRSTLIGARSSCDRRHE